MLIFNPLYDQVFKYLMENPVLAKKILETILDCEIRTLQIGNIEIPMIENDGMSVSRYDFRVTVNLMSGKVQEVLIEVQKYKSFFPIQRFRHYLGQSYQREVTYVDEKGETQTKMLPLVPIYILGFNLKEFKTPFVQTQTHYIDGIDKMPLGEIDSEFGALLTHNINLLICSTIKDYEWRNTRIEAFIRLFRQKTRNEPENSMYDIGEREDIKDELVREIADYLHIATHDETLKRKVKLEDEYEKTIQNLESSNIDLKKIAEEERRQKEEAKKEARGKAIKLAQKMKKYGEPIDEIIGETGLSREEIEGLE